MLKYTIYEHATAAEWVTFVHGAGGSSSIWFKQLRSFSAQFNVLILDLRGHGNSKPALRDAFNKKYTFDSITSDIV
jgi:pimeloyl-ACP methyl ester carboxylesterase